MNTIESPLTRLTPDQIEAIATEFAAIHDEVFSELGDRDRRYIVSMIEMHRRLVVLSRVVLLYSRAKPAWVAGTATLSLAKILENMEIGHNVMHGQWDWMNDPQISSSTWDWDSASTAEAWKHSHNYVHHPYTNIRAEAAISAPIHPEPTTTTRRPRSNRSAIRSESATVRRYRIPASSAPGTPRRRGSAPVASRRRS